MVLTTNSLNWGLSAAVALRARGTLNTRLRALILTNHPGKVSDCPALVMLPVIDVVNSYVQVCFDVTK